MKFIVNCFECRNTNNDSESYSFELTNDIVYEFTCNNGHNQLLIMKNLQYELLFDMGISALNDGYSREAVTSFAVALERFHEFCINVFAQFLGNSNEILPIKNGEWRNSDNTFNPEFGKTWKSLSNQSERQYGAYIMLYLVIFKRKPILIPDKYVKFRNDITHKGVLPTNKKASEYGEVVFQYIKEKLIELRDSMPEAVDYVCDKDYSDLINGPTEKYNGKTIHEIINTTSIQSTSTIEQLRNLDYETILSHTAKFRTFK